MLRTEKAAWLLWISFLLLTACGKHTADDFAVWGIDVSRHQKTIDWKKMCEEERPYFVFLKATEGTMITDPTYARHRKELEKHGILWGAYHFFGHRTPGKDQARHFIKTAGLQSGNLIPVLDIEWHRFMTDPKKSVREAREFCKEVKKHYGVNPIIYCSTNFYNAHLKEDFKPGDFILWIADYRGVAPDLNWTLWQHTETHKIPGIKGLVDRNVFRGKEDQLQKLRLK